MFVTFDLSLEGLNSIQVVPERRTFLTSIFFNNH